MQLATTLHATFCMQIGSGYLLTNLHGAVAISRLRKPTVFCKELWGLRNYTPQKACHKKNINKIVNCINHLERFFHTKFTYLCRYILQCELEDSVFYSMGWRIQGFTVRMWCFAMWEKTSCFTVFDIVFYSAGERIKIYQCSCRYHGLHCGFQ